MKLTRVAVTVSLAILLGPVSSFAENRPLPLTAARAVLLDPTGKVLFAKDADESHAPASLVKMMTLYIALEDIEAGRAKLDDVVTITQHAAMTPRYRMGLKAGERVPLHVLLDGVGIASANDAATAVAEHIGRGNEAAFVDRMNEKAKELGLTHTVFVNPHGLPAASQRSTARDLATLIARLVSDHPSSRTILGAQSFDYHNRTFTRHIPLFRDPGGVEALKTGFTREAGYNLAVTTWKAGQQFLMIVLGAKTRRQSFVDAQKMLHYGFVETGLEKSGDSKYADAKIQKATDTSGKSAARKPLRAKIRKAPRTAGVLTAPPRGFVFDAYGTLFDVHSVVEAARAITADPMALSLLWRQKQLEYTWLRSLMGRYEDFWAVTESALRHAVRRLALPATDLEIRTLMDAYLSLACFPEVASTLGELRGRPVAILSNGSPRMLEAAVRSSGLGSLVTHVLSVDAVRTYKPSPVVYAMGPEALGLAATDLLFVSGNAWDVAGGKAFGYQVCWCNRLGAPAEELGLTADHVVSRLDQIPR